MSKFDFDKIIDRRGSNALKVDGLECRYGSDDLIPLWVADMDFLSPKEVSEAIMAKAQHGVYGYAITPQSYYDSVLSWIKKEHQWEVSQEWMSFVPGVVKGISFAIDCFLSATDKVIIQSPVYPPFRTIPTHHKLKVMSNSLLIEDGQFKMDLDGLRFLAEDPSCRMLILCNPHNPGGRVWTQQELEAVAEICYETGILVIADEIHCDLALHDNKYIPFATVSEKAAQNSITFMAPSKTFNIAGIVSSYSVIPNDLLRDRFNEYLMVRELSDMHLFAAPATEAAYNHGGEWLRAAKQYIWDNVVLVKEFMEANVPQIKVMVPEASYLLWLDCTELGMEHADLVEFFIKDAKLALNDGSTFGKEGEGFMRMNVGCPRSVLVKALENIKKAVKAKHL